jgi:LysM repeat protein
VSDRGLPIADGAHACPFVAFEDERDERASLPDHRHRCFAENPPAPRALAHQEAYCLSSAFPVCPTFQDWARRESARARGESQARPAPPPPPLDPQPSEPVAAEAVVAADVIAPEPEPSYAADPDDDLPVEPPLPDDGSVRRNPPREWSAPPPWLASAEAGDASRPPSEPPTFLASRSQPGQGLAGSAADQLAGGPPPSRTSGASAAAGAAAAASAASASPARPDAAYDEPAEPPPPTAPRRPRAYDQHLGGPSSGPDWERPRRYEAYPTIKTRVGLPAVPRLAVMAGALAIAALVLFFLPAVLGLGSPNTANSSPTPLPSPSRSIEPTPTPVPTPVVYVIKKGDTLSKIATANGLTLAELMAANPSIKDPNKISEGQQITIPPPPGEAPPIGGSAAPSGSAAP